MTANTNRLNAVHEMDTTMYRTSHVTHLLAPLARPLPTRNQKGKLVVTPNARIVNLVTSMNENDITQAVGAATRKSTEAAKDAAKSPMSPPRLKPMDNAAPTRIIGYTSPTRPPRSGDTVWRRGAKVTS
jgi:hypothetical protein